MPPILPPSAKAFTALSIQLSTVFIAQNPSLCSHSNTRSSPSHNRLPLTITTGKYINNPTTLHHRNTVSPSFGTGFDSDSWYPLGRIIGAIVAYFFGEEVWDSGAGIVAAVLIAICLGYISRSIAGSYDNGGVATRQLQRSPLNNLAGNCLHNS
ncbi:hypothetical protein KIW84_060218 [Lathyrus oleraceus]|uniref:dolichyl-diphosphooligosaccharide--protein glycotransferase n=1 Tax=Pisum sativum TaxID=3888 RepID=A0A9D5A2I3_PEA|nr:hypothetical protein KIW84_060218 [Pisum sativum]